MLSSRLIRHPSSAAAPAIEIDASALILATGALSFRYRVRGAVRRIRLPPAPLQLRADDLWRHTCFEAFVKPKSSESYIELNFAPSGAWAAYSFERYRHGMKPPPAIEMPTIQCSVEGDLLTLQATVNMGPRHQDAALGLSAVIEDTDGNTSYWALAHPRAQPDFHDSAAWTSEFQRFGAEEHA
jgi:hypothetical protein